MSKTNSKSSAKQRIVEAAEKLFYAEGVRAVGIDRIISEASVAKMTLYHHFASKDDLILEVLHFRDEKINRFFELTIERHVTRGRDRLRAFFAALKEWFESSGFRGCAFINAVVELADANHPASKFAAQHKKIFRKMIKQSVVETAGARAATLVPAIAMLVEGAIVIAQMEGNSEAADVAKEAALKLVSAKISRKK